MAVFSATRRTSIAPEIAYAVAADVPSYKDFLPLLKRSSVSGLRRNTADGEIYDAELEIAIDKLKLRESFVSRVETNAAARTVTAHSENGPFRNLRTRWAISAAPGGSDVAIEIDYAFRNPMLQVAAAGLMDFAVQKIMAAFEERAKSIAVSAP